MSKGRLEAFSDGVLAIIITIMVLELKTPHEATAEALKPLIPSLLSYLLSFIHVGIYWNNHHHLFQAAREVNGRILWANLHLLFWLSLIPFVTGWMGHSHFRAWPVAAYGMVLFLSGLAFFLLTLALIGHHGRESTIGLAVGRDWKTRVSILIYAGAIALAFVEPLVSCSLYALVAIIWLAPDRRIETTLAHKSE
jgi:uncharacterized membrane protein